MRCLFAVAYLNLCKLELCKHLVHGNKAFSSRRRCRTRFGGYGVSCAAHVGTIAGERARARSASYEIGLSFCLSGKKIAPCSNIGTRGYPAVFGSITRTSFCFRFLPCAEALRCTRTPTAGKEHAFARFRTTACRLRSRRTLSASGRFSTSDSPPSIPLNLYSKGAAPREGLLLSSGSGYSIAASFLFVNDLINKNCIKCSAKTPNFHCLVPTPLRVGRWQILCGGAQKENRRAYPSAHSGSSFCSAVTRSGALTAEDPVVEVLAHVFSPPGRFAYGHCMRTGAKKCTNRRRGNRKNLKPSADCAIIYAYFPQPEPVSAGNTIFKG